MARQLLETEQKALEINLNDKIYGTFAEIGAGQEVARHFFQVGAAAGTIAKTMSAYDKVYSDQIYGVEASGRYVCENRLYKMLDHEYELIESRLSLDRPETSFFVFSDTVAAINYTRTIKGNGWLGIRFQITPDSEPNDLVLHVRMLDNDNQTQQQAIGILGVNLIYGVYNYYDNPEVLIESLIDNLRGRVKIDMVRLKGSQFNSVDNRLLSLWLVKHGLSDVAIFSPNGDSMHASEHYYKKNLLIVRGSFRPPTHVNLDMQKVAFQQFRHEDDVDSKRCALLSEITLDNLKAEGQIDEKDFLDRADLLCMLGHTVVVSNCQEHYKLIHYLADYKVKKLGIVLGVNELLELINQKYYDHQDGSLLAAFGRVFNQNVRYYVYPAMQEGSAELMKAENLPVPDGVKFLFRHLLDSGHLVDLKGYNPDILHIFSKQVLEMLQTGEGNWEEMVPKKVADYIKEHCLFHYPAERLEFEY